METEIYTGIVCSLKDFMSYILIHPGNNLPLLQEISRASQMLGNLFDMTSFIAELCLTFSFINLVIMKSFKN